MIRNLKALGLALIAVLAMGALTASAASAANFHTEQLDTTLTATATGEGHHVFDAAGLSITCAKADFKATTSSTSTTQTSITFTGNPGYDECEFIGATVSVFMNSCDYVFYANGEVEVACSTAGDEITFSGPGCTVKVPAQKLTGATYTTIGAGTTREVTMKPHVTNIKYTESGFLCGSGTTTNGIYTTGPVKVTGEKNGVHVGNFHTP